MQKTYLNKKKVICQMNEMANIVDRMQNRMIENSMPTLYEVTKQKCIKYWVLLYTVGHSIWTKKRVICYSCTVFTFLAGSTKQI